MDSALSHSALFQRYCSEEVCARELYRIRWPNGFVCPACGHAQATVIRTRRLPLFACRRCRHQTSLTAGTVMEKSKTSLSQWFQAMFWLARGATARQLSVEIRVTYKTAWLIAHKIRQAIHLAESESPLTGQVRAHQDRFGRWAFTSDLRRDDQLQPIIAAASISKNGELLRAKLHRVSFKQARGGILSKEAAAEFVRRHTSQEANVQLSVGLFNSSRYKPLHQWCRAAVREMTQTYFGIAPKHLQAYLDEYTYRHRMAAHQESAERELLQQCAFRPVITYPQLIRRTAS